MTGSELSIGVATPAPADSSRGGRSLLRRVAGYAISRGTTETLLGVRSVLLAALLGPAAFGSWALLRLGMRYAALAGLGVFRGLEVELLQADARGRTAAKDSPASTALGFILLVGGGLSAIAAAASFAVSDGQYRRLLLGFAVASLAELVYTYAMVCIRVRTGLRRYAILETSTAALHVLFAVALAHVWGLAGAFAGLALANLIGLSVAAHWVPLRPRLHLQPLQRLLHVGLPVALTNCVGILLVTADRWVVTFWGGPTMLGYYAFGASVTVVAAALALVIRTVVFRQVYGQAFSTGKATALRAHLEQALLPFARLLPPVLGLAGLAVGPLVAALLPGYTQAIAPARLFLLAGAAIGLVNLASIGALAAGMQRRLPLYAGGALALTTGLSILALASGAGLEAVAAAALLGYLVYAAAMLRLIVRESGARDVNRFVLITLLPLIWCSGAAALAGRLVTDNTVSSAAFGVGVYALLLLPLAGGWRTELRRLRG
ncbi:MAG: lipopolysaccharide biosynthesis protein [Gemmatimonadales bacterium]